MSETGEQRRLATILVADVVGYSRLIGIDETGTLAALKSRQKQILEPLVASHRGRVVKFLGDGVLLEFPSAVNAVQCGLALQKGMTEANSDLPEHQQIVLRIGVNIGDVVLEGADVFGDGVNIAARLESLASPGEMCISANVYEIVRGKLNLSVEDLGERELKNIGRPVRAYRVSGEGNAWLPAANRAQFQNLLSIAVMPFDNMSGSPENDYIGESIADSIITDLARFHDLTVVARNISFAYKGRATRVQDIRRDLGVNYVIDGSIQKAGGRVRATAQLIECATGKHLWADRYDRQADDIFTVMDEISELIVGALGTTYGGRLHKAASDEADSAAASETARAFDHFVKGTQELCKLTKVSLALALEHLSMAVTINPRFAKAYAKIAWANLSNVNLGWAPDDQASLAAARIAADTAIKYDDGEAWAHSALTGCAVFAGQHDWALFCKKRALELNPNDADVLAEMGYLSTYMGNANEGVPYVLKAKRLNPHHPEFYGECLGQIYFSVRNYEAAINAYEEVGTLRTPTFFLYSAASYAALGQETSARAAVARLLAEQPLTTIGYWANSLRSPYRREEDREHLVENLRLAGMSE